MRIRGESNGEEIEYFYSFTAGPGGSHDHRGRQNHPVGTTGNAFEELLDARMPTKCCFAVRVHRPTAPGHDRGATAEGIKAWQTQQTSHSAFDAFQRVRVPEPIGCVSVVLWR